MAAADAAGRGVVAVRWSRSGSSFALNATVPVGSVANVALPMQLGEKQLSTVAEATMLVWGDGAYKPGVAGFNGATKESAPYGVVVFSVGSGGYNFAATYA